jgi:hypothetical protein
MLNQLSSDLIAGVRNVDVVGRFETEIGLPLASILAPQGVVVQNGHGHVTRDERPKQFIFFEPFRLPAKLNRRMANVAVKKSGRRLAEGCAYLAFVASHAWTIDKHSAGAHVRWGLFLESDKKKHEQAAPVFTWLLRQIAEGSTRMAVQPCRPIPGFPQLWHTWVGREIPALQLPAFGSVGDLCRTIAQDLVDLHQAVG